MRKGKLITPVTVLAVAIYTGAFAAGSWLGLGLAAYARLHPELPVKLPPAVIYVIGAPGFTGVTVWLMRVRKRLLRARAGLCVVCGYDVRASGDRCPECGRVVVELAGAVGGGADDPRSV